jgi:hypothetical protein
MLGARATSPSVRDSSEGPAGTHVTGDGASRPGRLARPAVEGVIGVVGAAERPLRGNARPAEPFWVRSRLTS